VHHAASSNLPPVLHRVPVSQNDSRYVCVLVRTEKGTGPDVAAEHVPQTPYTTGCHVSSTPLDVPIRTAFPTRPSAHSTASMLVIPPPPLPCVYLGNPHVIITSRHLVQDCRHRQACVLYSSYRIRPGMSVQDCGLKRWTDGWMDDCTPLMILFVLLHGWFLTWARIARQIGRPPLRPGQIVSQIMSKSWFTGTGWCKKDAS
jgi:hypothetical protein